MWKAYSNIIHRYPRITLSEEKHLIAEAQKGSKKSKDEIVLRHVSFLIFRICRKVFPSLIQRFGEDLLEETILIVYKKVETYCIVKKITNSLITQIMKADYTDCQQRFNLCNL